MEPLSALSLASAVIQIVDFSSKDATTNLTDLLETLAAEKSRIRYQRSGLIVQKTADRQLLELAKNSRAVANTIHATINRIKRKKDGGGRNAFDQGLRSVLKQKEVSSLAKRLGQIRKQVDTTLLVSLRSAMLGALKSVDSCVP
ncbi:hypothetical protein BKA66DRAFT_511136 [Pyrenochaeta sp. MPI-SDFR-AT-0127]|nr:hypothetical protein BKA66DRAFT_511136 [Pyrenochaeta sp. MPI-SDFR-AT-0127]